MNKELEKLFMQESPNTIIARMVTVLNKYDIKKILNPVIVSASIEDEDAVIEYIKSIYPFTIIDLNINLLASILEFKVYGTCFVPEKYSPYKLIDGMYSRVKTKECNTFKEIKKEYPNSCFLPLGSIPGIKCEYI